MSKRPRREAAVAATKRLALAPTLVAEVAGVHDTKSIALTSQDVIEDMPSERDAIYRGTTTTLVTLYTDDRPKRLPRGTVHVGAAFEDNSSFSDDTLTAHLDRMAAAVDSAATPRVVFVCQAGINRSSLALCYYCVKHGGGCHKGSWKRVKQALVEAKGAAASGWPTLVNAAFEAYLSRRFPLAAAATSQTPLEAGKERWFWRTVVTARPSLGGKGVDPAVAAARQREWEEEMRWRGIDPKTGRTYGCWANGRVGGQWIRGVPGKKRPWTEGDDDKD